MQNAQALEDWLRIHGQLVELETAFAELALQVARGEVPLAVLDAQRVVLVETRELCSAAYARAFQSQRR